MSLIAQIVILMIVLACMVMVLLAIRQLTNYEGFEDREETIHLEEEVKEDGHVLTGNSIFKTLVDASPDEDIFPEDLLSQKHNHNDFILKENRNHNSKSKEPFSRRE